MRLTKRRLSMAGLRPVRSPLTANHGIAPMTRMGRGSGGRFTSSCPTGLAAYLVALLLMLSITPAARAETVHVLAQVTSVDQVLTNIRNWIMGILAGLTVVFLTVGFVRYIFAGGDPGELQKAKTAWKSAGWGFGGAALAPLIVEIFKGIVGMGS
ncbi:pilin [Saccharothrix saharensis]|uniref:pilin n=1 Tax=Saccharothrix saharensis TaxID=571190 RepID=UPI0036A98A9E